MPPRPNQVSRRELEIAREIGQALLTATTPVEVYRIALARLTPLVQARFGSVFLRDPSDEALLKLACAHNWPQAGARYLSQFRVRVGRGPAGRAVAEARAVEVTDVFADPELREWWDPARELGFASLVTLPLRIAGNVCGALGFYFEEPRTFQAEERDLLALVADQLSAAAEKAHLIDELQRANERLERRNRQLGERIRDAEQAKRLKEEFLANVSHELRTPLVSVLGYATLLKEGHAGTLSPPQTLAVTRIEAGASLLLRLITDLLYLVQLKLGRTRPQPSRTEAVGLARQALDAAGDPPDGVDVRFQAPEDRIPVETDAEKAVAVLEKLISNAFKFTPQGEVVVAVRTEPRRARAGGWRLAPDDDEGQGAGPDAELGGRWVAWEVRDTGIGIAEGDLELIFDEFRQVDGSSTRLYGGTGLGLAVSRRLARLLGGEILVRSEPGRGSSFLLRLPSRMRVDA